MAQLTWCGDMSIGGFAESVENRIDNGKISSALRRAFNSYLFPVVVAAVIVTCYYLAWDLVSIWFLAACMVGILIVCKDITPLITTFLFANITTSKQLSPAYGNTETFYLQKGTLVQLCTAIGIVVLFMIIRTCYYAAKGYFKPTASFWFVCAFALSLIPNGLFSAEYQAMGTLFGLLLALTFIATFILISGGISANEDTLKKIAVNFLVFAVVLIAELIVAYQLDVKVIENGKEVIHKVIENGRVERSRLTFGWGGYNNMGMWLTCALPSAFYLATKSRRFSWLFTVFAVGILVAAFCTMSRQAMLGSLIVFALGCVWLFIVTGGRERIINISVVVLSAVIIAVLWIAWTEELGTFFGSFWNSLQTGSGRTEIWKAALEVFKKNPVFGAGFYTKVNSAAELQDGITFLPPMNHNTIMELASACGAVGIIAYCAHRAQTVISLVRDFTTSRIYIALIICAFLLVSLFDNYVFYILTTVTYVYLIALFDKADKNAFKAHALRRINKTNLNEEN